MFTSFKELEAYVLGCGMKKRIALANAHDEPALSAVVNARRKGVVDLVADGTLRSDEARPRLNDLGKEIERLEAGLARMRADSPLADLAAADAVRERWSKLDVVRRRQILEALELRITVDPVDRVADGSRWTWVLDDDGKRTIDPSRLRYASVVD